MNRRLTKIRYADRAVTIGFESHDDGLHWTGEIVSDTEPDPDFQAALRALKPFVPMICTPIVLASEFEEHATVTGISISYKDEARPGYVIKAKCPVKGANGPLNIATPMIVEPKQDSGEYAYREELFKAFRRLVEQAEHYLEGERAQAELPFPEQPQNGRRPAAQKKPRKQEDQLAAKRRDKEIDRALLDIVQLEVGCFQNTKRQPIAIVADRVLDRFEGYAYKDPSNDREWVGVHRHATTEGRVVWCGLSTEGAVTRFWYDIQPDSWDPSKEAPTLIGEVLANRVLFAHQDAAAAKRQAEQPAEEPEPAGV